MPWCRGGRPRRRNSRGKTLADKALFVQYGMKRSGNHAISNALQPALAPHVFNNIVPMAPVYEGSAEVPPLTRFEDWLSALEPHKRPADWTPGARAWVSLEDLPVTLDAFGADDPVRILVLRSFENMMSSRIRKGFKAAHPAYPVRMDATMARILATWKQHVRSYLRLEGPGRVAVLFDLWVADPAYRARIAQRLGIAAPDERAVQGVSETGGGSSFDGTRYDGRAGKMDVLARAGQLSAAERRLLDETMADAEIRALSGRIAQADPVALI